MMCKGNPLGEWMEDHLPGAIFYPVMAVMCLGLLGVALVLRVVLPPAKFDAWWDDL